jgi:hypothetical protein
MDPHHFGNLDPHQSDKLDPEPDSHQFAVDELKRMVCILALFQGFEPLFGS